jgi:hypothetical protein
MALTKIGKEGIAGISNASNATFLTATSAEGVTLAGTLAVTGIHTVGENAIYDSEGGAVTQNLVQGLAKMWVHFDGNTGNDIRDSVNISSVADNSAGRYTYTYTNNMNNYYYQFTHSCGGASGTVGDENYGSTGGTNVSTGITTSTFFARNRRYDGNTYDVDIDSIMLHGDLA